MSDLFVKTLPALAAADLRALAAQRPERYPCLLTSVGGEQGTFDLLLLGGTERLTLSAGESALALGGTGRAAEFVAEDQDFCDALDRWFRSEAVAEAPAALPFIGGWFLYLSYELAAQLEPSLTLPLAPAQPVAVAARCTAAILLSHSTAGDSATGMPTGTALLVVEGDSDAVLKHLERDLVAARTSRFPQAPAAGGVPQGSDADAYQRSVRQAQRAIVAGDVYQANLSRRWQMPRSGIAPGALFDALCQANPAPFAAYVVLEGLTVVSSSPERLVASRAGRVSTRPIAGTRPRSADADEDARLVAELMAHPKERAEHVMLIDLERNDLGRISATGTVAVDEYMVTESYQHVHHIVSNVVGELLPGTTPGQIIRAVFPGGTITGCPKVRCMQLIADLEGRPRGAYTGSVGYLSRDGQMDLNILIRTFEVTDEHICFSAGAGIVADSVPEAELAETAAKALGMLPSPGGGALMEWLEESAALPLDDRGLNYGDGLFETLRAVNGAIPFIERHLTRLAAGLDRLRINGVAMDPLRQRLIQLAENIDGPDGWLKVLITRGSGPRGYQPAAVSMPRILTQAGVLAPADSRIPAQWCEAVLPTDPLLGGMKHLNRLPQVMAAQELRAGQEGLMCDSQGDVVCGVAHNLFVVIDGQVSTPAGNVRRGCGGDARMGA